MQCKRPIYFVGERQTDKRREGPGQIETSTVCEGAREGAAEAEKRNSETKMENNAVSVCMCEKVRDAGEGYKDRIRDKASKKSRLRSRFEAKSHEID